MNTDDPQFTAYALAELEPAEREALARELQADPAAAQAITELQALAARLRTELSQEGPMELTPARRAALLAEAQAPRRMPPPRRVWIPAAIAAMLVGLLGAGAWLTDWRPAAKAPVESRSEARGVKDSREAEDLQKALETKPAAAAHDRAKKARCRPALPRRLPWPRSPARCSPRSCPRSVPQENRPPSRAPRRQRLRPRWRPGLCRLRRSLPRNRKRSRRLLRWIQPPA